MRRVRTSTWVLLAIFLGTLVLYLWVKPPAPSTTTGSSANVARTPAPAHTWRPTARPTPHRHRSPAPATTPAPHRTATPSQTVTPRPTTAPTTAPPSSPAPTPSSSTSGAGTP